MKFLTIADQQLLADFVTSLQKVQSPLALKADRLLVYLELLRTCDECGLSGPYGDFTPGGTHMCHRCEEEDRHALALEQRNGV